MSLSSEKRAAYTQVIDSILADKNTDLNEISEKRIRKGLQETLDYDITPQKAAVKALILERFDIFVNKQSEGSPSSEETVPPTETANGHGVNGNQDTSSKDVSLTPSSSSPQKRQAESDEMDEDGSKSPEPKKRKPDPDVDADALFAAKLQAEENKLARPTRGSATRKSAPGKKRSKAKTAKKVKAEDDSDVDSSSGTGSKKEVNRSGGFHKPLNLSPALSALLDGEISLSRPQTVKRLWKYIHAKDLQDPSDRRQIRCDDRMRAVFKQDRIHMFTMTKILNQNLYAADE